MIRRFRAAALLTVLTTPLIAQEPRLDVYAERRDAFARIEADFANARRALDQVHGHVRALPAADLETLRSAAVGVVRHCPYRHATVRTLAILRQEVHDLRGLPLPGAPGNDAALRQRARTLNERLTRLAETLDRHWQLLALLGVTDVEPADSARLPRQVDAEASAGETIEDVIALLKTVQVRVSALSKDTQTQLERDARIAARDTAGCWDSKELLIHYRQEIGAIREFAATSRAAADRAARGGDRAAVAYANIDRTVEAAVARLTEMLNVYLELYC